MSTAEAKRRAKAKYLAENVDNIMVRVPKGQKEYIQDHAQSMCESTNAFINRAIKEAIDRDTDK